MKNTHKGETCIIIGNGPSLRATPLRFLDMFSTFGTNKIFKFLDFTPTYYVSVDPKILDRNANKIKQMRSKAVFVPEDFKLSGDNVVQFKEEERAFSTDLHKGIYPGWTVTFVCLQIAYWMGFDTILLIGVDHYYEYPEDTFWEAGDFICKPLISDGNDINHFSSDYHEDGEEYMVANDLRKMEESYVMAKAAYENSGRRIVNLTLETKLDIFEKGKLWHWM